jgi:hypothetical protein
MAHRHQTFEGRDGDATQALAQGLGWFSIGLGVAELVAPGQLARFLGMEERTELIRAYGAREIVTGVGILAQEDPTPWMWGRLGGDVLDLGTLATGLGRDNPQRGNVGLAVAAVAGVMALDLICAWALSRDEEWPSLPIRDSARRGMPRPPAAMRGTARDFPIPRDMRFPNRCVLIRPADASPGYMGDQASLSSSVPTECLDVPLSLIVLGPGPRGF